jgi:hypothetical protein
MKFNFRNGEFCIELKPNLFDRFPKELSETELDLKSVQC